MAKSFRHYFDTVFQAAVDKIFRKKTLTSIAWLFSVLFGREVITLGAGEAIIEFCDGIKEKYDADTWQYIGATLLDIAFGKGSFLVLGILAIAILVILIFRYLDKRRETKPTIIIEPVSQVPKALTPLPLANQGTEKQSYFVGREKELESIHQLLADNKTVLLLNGIGGIGKTTLARQYMSDQYETYDHIAWISVLGDGEGEGYQTAAQAFANEKNLFKSLGIPFDPKAGDIERRKEILEALRSLEGNNLLIIDNAGSSAEEIRPELPTPPSWQVLLTSRQRLNGVTIKKIDELSPEEAKKLFLLHYPAGKNQREDIQALCAYIGYHTLTIELFAKCCQTYSLTATPAKILALLKEKELVKLSKKVWTDHSDREVEVYSYLLAAFQLGDLSEQEKELLAQWAILPPEEISVDLLVQLFQVTEDELDSFEKKLTDLAKKGWIMKNDLAQTYRMHQLIQEVIRYQLPATDYNVATIIDGAANVLSVDDTKDNPVDKFPLVIFGEFLLTHISSEDTRVSRLQNNLALVYQDLGRYESAASLLEAALESDLVHFGEAHPTVAVRRSNLGAVYRDLGRYESAASLLEAALASDLAHFGESHPNVAKRRSNLALVYKALGRHEAAASLLEAALESYLVHFGKNHPNVAVTRSNLALVYKDLGRYESAASLLEAALESDVAHFGEAHPSVARIRSNLATVYLELDRQEEARKLFESAYAIFLKVSGADHPHTQTVKEWLDGME
ncbi:MAG: tetratricopeptide repeat protein [Bacteroidota bacterium]